MTPIIHQFMYNYLYQWMGNFYNKSTGRIISKQASLMFSKKAVPLEARNTRERRDKNILVNLVGKFKGIAGKFPCVCCEKS